MKLAPRTALLLTLPALLWALNTVIGHLAIHHVPPVRLNAFRWLLSLVILLPLGRRLVRDVGALRERWGYLAIIGLLGVGCYNSLQYVALQTSSPINVTLISASQPVWAMTVGALFFSVRPTGRQYFSALLSLIGVGLVISRGSLDALQSLRLVSGDFYVLLANVLWAIYGWMLARPPAHMVGERRPAWNWAEMLLPQVVFGALWASLFAGIEQAVVPQAVDWSWALVAALVFLAIGPSVLAYRFWAMGVDTVGPTAMGFFTNLTPLFAALLSAVVLREPPRWFHAVAFLLIVAGIALTARQPSTSRTVRTSPDTPRRR